MTALQISKTEFPSIDSLLLGLEKLLHGRRAFILTDSTVKQLWVEPCFRKSSSFQDTIVLEVAPGELSKSIGVCSTLWNTLLEYSADRNTVLINIGGGSITDLGGFVASTYKRGIGFIHIPTTLLAMVDAAHGGKNGINHHHTKNCIGNFQLPIDTLICSEFLTTLPYIELKSGFAEMLKHGLLGDKSHWNELTSENEITLEHIRRFISTSNDIKLQIVGNDFYEQGERKLLNLGHTVGHAIESYFLEVEQPISHGEAVALGIICETEIAYQLNNISKEDKTQIINSIHKFYHPEEYHLPSFAPLRNYIQNDKKNHGTDILMSIPTNIGNATYDIKVPIGTVEKSYNLCFK